MKLYRASGLPIEPSDAESYKETFRNRYDELEKVYGKATQENSQFFQTELEKLEDECLVTFPRSRDIQITDLPVLIREFKSAIAVTLAMVDGEEQVAAYIMDQEG